MNKTEGKNLQVKLHFNPQLNTLWTDALNIGITENNQCLLRFMSSLPEGILEQARVMTTKDNLMKFIDILCSSLDYYPTKVEKK